MTLRVWPWKAAARSAAAGPPSSPPSLASIARSPPHRHHGPHPSPLPEGEGEKAASAPSWANSMPRRPRRPDAACRRGIALVTGTGMRYDVAVCLADFGHFQPIRPPIAATHRALARPNPGGAHGARSSVVPARSPRPSPWRGPGRACLARPEAPGLDGLSGCRGSGASAII
jgi:hypothetical protein